MAFGADMSWDNDRSSLQIFMQMHGLGKLNGVRCCNVIVHTDSDATATRWHLIVNTIYNWFSPAMLNLLDMFSLS